MNVSDPRAFRLRILLNGQCIQTHYMPASRLVYATRVVSDKLFGLDTGDRYALVADRGNLNIILWRK